MSTSNRVKWVDDIDAYKATCRDSDRRAIPLLRPAESHRVRQWTTVLEWYQLRFPTYPHDAASLPLPATHSPTELVVVGEGGAVHMAEILSAHLGRSLVIASDARAIIRVANAKATKSVLLVAPAGELTHQFLINLSERVRCPWGILTARDLAGLSFQVAKLLAEPTRPRPSAMIDCISRTGTSLDPYGKVSTTLDGDALRDWLLYRDWRFLALSAHGDGAHLDLFPFVGCGVGVGESYQGHSVRGGCLRSGRNLVCRRAKARGRRPLALDRVRAETVFLWSCVACSVAGQGFPTDNSAALSLFDGFTRTLIAPIGYVPTSEVLPRVFSRLLFAHHDTWAALQSLNSASASALFRAFVLFGDPVQAETRPTAPAPSITHLGPDTEPVLRLHSIATRPPIIRTATSTIAVRTRKHMLLDGSESDVRHLSPDLTVNWKRARRDLDGFSSQMFEMARIERALLEQCGVSQAARVWPMASLREQRAGIEADIYSSRRILATIGESGVWDDRLVQLFAALRESAFLWAQAMGSALHSVGPDLAIESLIRSGTMSSGRRSAGLCPRCRSPVMCSDFELVTNERRSAHVTDCSVCGVQGAWLGNDRVIVPLGEVTFVENRLTFRLDFRRGGHQRRRSGTLLTDRRCSLVISVKDKGTGLPLVHTVFPSEFPACVSLLFSKPCTSELQSFRCTWVAAASIGLVRHRFVQVST